jgi:hypothetical protein
MPRCWRTTLWLRCAKSVDSATPASRAASVTWQRDNGRPDLQAPAIHVARLLPPSTSRGALLAYARTIQNYILAPVCDPRRSVGAGSVAFPGACATTLDLWNERSRGSTSTRRATGSPNCRAGTTSTYGINRRSSSDRGSSMSRVERRRSERLSIARSAIVPSFQRASVWPDPARNGIS